MNTFILSSLYWIAASLVYFWIIFSKWTGFLYHNSCIDYSFLKSEYDYIIVGAGSAGVIVSTRLAEDPNVSVLLIDAGSTSSSWFLNVPIISPLLQLSALDWQFDTVEQKYGCFSLKGNSSRWPRGRAVGGTSRLNYMMYVRGHRRDFDSWAAQGNPGWTFQDTFQYFKTSERQRGRFQSDVQHSTSGPMVVSDIVYASPLAEAFIEAGLQLGFPVRDINSNHQTGFMQTQVHIDEGRRWSVDHGYIANNKANLDIMCDTHVEKVLFRHNFEAHGVEGLHLDERITVEAVRGVILSSGTVGSPSILMRSGIGPRTHLEDLEIPVLVDLPVGKNLQDHITTGMDLVLLNQSLALDFGNIASVTSVWQYLNYGRGPWTSSGCEAFAVVHSKLSDVENDPPDLQIMALPMGLSSDYGGHMKEAMGIRQEVWDNYFAFLMGKHVASIMPVLLHPRSCGEILLQSKNPNHPPVINPNYLSHDADIQVLYEGIQLVKEIIHSSAMQKLGAQLFNKSFPGCEGKKFDSEEYWRCYIQHLTLTSYHPVGTCKMGPRSDPSSVVNSDLQVHGTNNLFVVDAAVMPSLPSANINAAVMMIAEKGADLVKQKWYQSTVKKTYLDIFYEKIYSKE